MALEDKFAQHDKIVVDKYVNPTADYEMSTYDYVVRPSADPSTGPITITLPRVAEAKGRFYSILARDADGTNTITIQDQDDSELWSDITLNGPGDQVLLYSDGIHWWSVVSILTYSGTTAAPTTIQSTTAAPTTA